MAYQKPQGNRRPGFSSGRPSSEFPRSGQEKRRNSGPRSSPRFQEDEDSHGNRRNPRPFEAEDGLIIGRNPVLEALKSERPLDTLFVSDTAGGSIPHICSLAKEQGIVVKSVSEKKLDQMAHGASHQGVIAAGACAQYASLEDLLAVSKEKGAPPFLVVCDEIEDPHNLGAILRTAEAAGADGVILPKRRSASLNSTVFKTSAGAASWLPVARVPNLPAALDQLKAHGIWIYGTDAEGGEYTKCDLTGPVAWVIGSEGFGLGRLVREKCDFLLRIPMMGKITSLNASVAAGIFLYETVRQRQGPGVKAAL